MSFSQFRSGFNSGGMIGLFDTCTRTRAGINRTLESETRLTLKRVASWLAATPLTRTLVEVGRWLAHVAKLSESELRERTREILKNIGDWLGASQDEQLVRRCEALGQQRFEEGIPLHEVVLARFIIKEGLTEFVHDHAFTETSLQLYAEGELEKCIGHLFDRMIYYVIRGYEETMREVHHHAHAAATHHRS